MELIESTDPYLCLNMIVKNEGHIIKDTLTKLLKKVPAIDYWVISDTGSTDETKKIISDFFKERNIKGELFDDDWKDFGHNRTKALEHAFGKSRFLMVFDADDEICGDFVLPDLKIDSYHFQFGDANGTSYTRTQIVNNKKKWKYVGVLHEIITCTEHSDGMDTIKGNYYTISGKSGSRSQDQNKYQKDALILEKAYEEAVKNNDELYNRYGFYCANSYYDSGKWENAIKWYKITLDNKNWSQEKYISCLRLYHCYNALNQKESGMFYLVKSFSYDKERAECLYELVSYYGCNDMNEVAYSYYNITKSFYNERYLKDGLNDKLFLDLSKANLLLPYYMILVADKVKDHDTTIQMYRIIFTKKHIERSKHYIGNMLYNLQFFIERVKDDKKFLRLFQEYVEFLISINYPVYDHDFMVKYEKYGIKVPKISDPLFSLDVCFKSKNILLYSGYSPFKWNYTFSINNALGGSETAITCLTKNFPKDYTIYVAGDVEEEAVENIRYVHFNNLNNLIKTTAFHSIIVSRYLNFYELYRNFSAYQTFIWGHDVTLYAYGTDLSVEGILSKWASKITGCICQTEWHKNLFLSSFPQLKDKISTINNGINVDLFNSKDITKVKKMSNRFIYTSCSERGLYKLVQLWPSILENLPDAELMISSYNNFPKSDEDIKILEIITKIPSIKHMGKLNKTELYNLMASAEYWLYTSYFQETSCITSLELLASEVICLYYPVAGLVNTVGDYGIPISEGNELDALLSLSIKKKNELKRKGKEYALSCSWKNRAHEWMKIILAKEPEQEPEKNNIKIINLKRREDRKKSMIEQFERENIKISEYEFIEAVDGAELKETEEIRQLFEDNNFNYKKSVIGCALSHLQIYNNLINDANNDYYIVLEDDVELSNNFKQKLNELTNEFVKQDIEHLALALSLSNNESELNGGEEQQLQLFQKDVYKLWNVGFAYIISKKAARKIISFINNCSIKCAIDNPQAYGEVIKYHYANRFIVKHKNMDMFGSDINTNHNLLHFTDTNSKQDLKIAYCDWWYEEYCGGSFDFNNNFITDILLKYGNINSITVVQPHESPDVLLYSIFGNHHTHFPNLRKVFFSGEPFGIRAEAAFNFTFDRNSDKNIRFPLWLGYLNSWLLEECSRRKNGIINVPKRENFCSFIANGEVKTTHRRTIVEKLSKYKKVHCGGKYLNNIGFTVPRGVNCSGKIEHNNKYKFAIAFENEDYPGYVTEKICDIYKSNCVPIYWGTKEVVNDFNPSTFINACDFENFDELVDYIIKVDNDDELYASYFKEPMFSNKWLDAFNDPNKTFYKNLADCIIGKNSNLYNNYLFNNNNVNNNKEKWVVYGPEYTYTLIKEYINNLNLKYCVKYVTNIKKIQTINPSKILFINNIHDNSVFNIFKNTEISILNIDSLYIPYFLNNIFEMIYLYPNIKIYDYSLKNIEVLQKYNIRTEFLEYAYDEKEINNLKEINDQEKIYDFGIICYYKDVRCNYRRKNIVELLRSKGYTVNVACGFNRERDIELGKCKIILNIHHKSFNIECRTFEHLRCNRLLYAGFKILSEVSYVDDDFISKYKENIKFIKYDGFENITRENIDTFNFISEINNDYICKKETGIFNIWHNKLFDKCYDKLDDYSLKKITMYDVNQKYSKEYNKERKYNIVSEYKLDHYNSLYQETNYCQTSCLYHVFKNKLYANTNYIGFIQYDMELASDFIYDMEQKINSFENDTYFYSLTVANKVEVNYICKPYDNSILEKYNNYFSTSHTYESIKAHHKADKFICLHTFVIPTKTFINMMTWYCTITDWLHANYINGIYSESMSEVTEEIFGLFLLLQMIENDNIQLEELKLHHEWPNLHNDTNFINYKDPVHYFSLDKIVDNRFTDKNTCHSYLETYEKLLKDKHLTCKNVLEIGIQRGGSMKLWNDYFVNANIYGIDVSQEPDFLKHYNRVKCLKMNAYSQDSIDYFSKQNIVFDFIIDDGPHTLDSMIYFIKNYLQLLDIEGILIVEDVQNISWCDTFKTLIPNGYTYEIIDLRHIKNRWDDILFVIKKSEIITENIQSIIVNNIEKIKAKFNNECNSFSDINEHLPTLYSYAKDCESIIECGVRGCVSSWAFAAGLLDNNKPIKNILLNDIEPCNIDEFLKLTQNTPLIVNYDWCSDLDLQVNTNVDLTFIDTFHVYGQLKRELEKFSKVTNKYIIMHDTTVDEIYGECIRNRWNAEALSSKTGFPIEEINKGLQPAIDEFLKLNPDWSLHKKYTNNNGLTILKKSQIITENIKLEINEIVTKPQYNFCVMSIFKNETMNLKMWIEHYLWQGVEHFYLIDNGSDDNPFDILKEYIDKGFITYYYRAEKHQQVQHYKYVFDNERLKEKTKWLCICDLDEFFFGTEQKIVNTIDQFENYNVIYTNSFFYGSDNLVDHPSDIRTSILHREADIENGTKYIFKPSAINDSSEIWIHWLVNPGTLQKKQMCEITQNDKIRLNHYRIQSFEYYSKVKMTRGDVSIQENENIRDFKYFEHYTNVATIKDDILKQIIEKGYNNRKENIINTAVIVEARFLKHLPFVINDYYKKLGLGWKIVFYCGVGLKNIWIDLLSNDDIEIRELKKKCYKYNEYCDFIKSKELYETLYGDYVLLFTSNSAIINKPPYTIDYYMGLNKSYIGSNQCYLWNEMIRENIHPQYKNFQGGLSLRKRMDMIRIINTFGTQKTLENCGQSQSLQTDAEDVYFAIGCYKLGLPVGDDDQSSHFSVHNYLKDGFFGANSLNPGYYLNLIQQYDTICDNIYLFKNMKDIENETLVIHQHDGGFFSNCTVKLFDIILYFNAVKKLPIFIDGSQQFELYKAGTNMNDITYEYFYKNFDYEINYEYPIDFRENYQYVDYNKLNFNQLNLFIKKYFSPSKKIIDDIEYIENKYNIDNYHDVCVLFYRGNDKITETALPSYETIIEKARTLYNQNNNIKFLVQSDETNFIERMTREFPNNSFYFKDEIRTIKKSNDLSVDKINSATNFVYSQYYLAITIIMSKCKYIVCTTGNCSLWIALFRGNAENVNQL